MPGQGWVLAAPWRDTACDKAWGVGRLELSGRLSQPRSGGGWASRDSSGSDVRAYSHAPYRAVAPKGGGAVQGLGGGPAT